MSPRTTDAEPPQEKLTLAEYQDSKGNPHLVDPSLKETRKLLRKNQGLLALHPEQEGSIKLLPKINLDPTFNTNAELAELLAKGGVVILRPVSVINNFGTFQSKESVLSVIIHGSVKGQNHLVDNVDSAAYYAAVRDELLNLGIRPPQMFISCDDQVKKRESDLNIRVRRFGQDGRYQVLSFPYLLNMISVNPDNGIVTVHEVDMKQEAQANSGSPFANPKTADYRLLQMIVELFNCPPQFLKLMSERVESQIKIKTSN